MKQAINKDRTAREMIKTKATLCTAVICLCMVSCSKDPNKQTTSTVPVYGYKILNTYPHDTNASTQGLVYEDGFLYEGTGRYGYSEIRKVGLTSGREILSRKLESNLFGEGITILGDKIYQLTWKAAQAMVYDKKSFKLLKKFDYTGEGWGITTDGINLIVSDGTSTLSILDPETFETINTIQVTDTGTPVEDLNELEFIKGKIYANVWHTDRIAIIDPHNGKVTAWIDLAGLYADSTNIYTETVLNGIAYDPEDDRIFVTGKLWPKLYEIEIIK